jgi:predicted amidophosphoribosyltransferase
MNAPGGTAKAFLRRSQDFLWPPRSLISGARTAGEAPLSPEDFRSLTFITDPVCNLCGLPQDYDAGAETVCAACTAKPPRWGRARAALVYDDLSRRPVLDLKRAGRRDGLKQVAGRHVVLVDDVLTTGATLSACTRALKQAGARQIDVIVLARVVRATDLTI